MRRKLVIAVILALIGSAFSADFSSASQFEISTTSVKPIELKQINSKLRIVSLANGAAEILNSLGLRNSIVGRDIASTTPELKAIPIVTSGHQVIAEKVIALKPSLVIIDASVGPKSAIDAIKKAKIKVRGRARYCIYQLLPPPLIVREFPRVGDITYVNEGIR